MSTRNGPRFLPAPCSSPSAKIRGRRTSFGAVMPSTPTRPRPSITLRGISACRSISAGSRCSSRNCRSSRQRLSSSRLLRRRDARIRHHPIGHEMAGKVLWQNRAPAARQKAVPQPVEFLSVAASSSLFIQFRSREVGAAQCSHARPRVQSGALGGLSSPNASRRRVFASIRVPLSCTPGWCRIRCRRRRRRRG